MKRTERVFGYIRPDTDEPRTAWGTTVQIVGPYRSVAIKRAREFARCSTCKHRARTPFVTEVFITYDDGLPEPVVQS